jgi:regulator of RNase E activity RraA
MEEDFNVIVRIGDIQVRPGDVVAADINGVVVIPVEDLETVFLAAESILAKESAMIDDLRSGMSMLDVDKKHRYESMLKEK